ncbi:MAG: 30S ribosomal protein S6 [Actinobacteria bacterium]|nr:30S ribosomal protein S6 [Actinomycetota bacterium]
MKNYELVLIFVPTLEEGTINEELAKITSLIEKSQGNISKTDTWGIKKLAYPIKHQENGFYIIVYFESGTQVLAEIDRINKINDKILRHLIVKTSDK